MKPSSSRIAMLLALLQTEEMKDKIMVHGSPARYAEVTDNGKIILYTTEPKWWARLIRRCETMGLAEFLILVTKEVTGIGGARDERLWTALSQEILNNIVVESNPDLAIDAVIDTIRFGSNISPSKYLKINEKQTNQLNINVRTNRPNTKMAVFNCYTNSGEPFPVAVEVTEI